MRAWKNARQVGRELNIHHKTVQRWWMRWRDGEGCQRRPGSGRPRKTTPVTDRKLIIACKRNRFDSVPKLTVVWNFGSGVNCSVHTAYRRLAEAGIRCYRPAVRIPLTPRHKRARKEWCRERSEWPQEQWHQVMWSDESRFALDFHDGRIHVHRLKGQRFASCCLREHDRYGGGSVLVWAAIWHGGRSALSMVNGMMTGQRYRDEILLPTVIPTVQGHSFVFQHDNAPPHRAAIVTHCHCLIGHQIPTLPWPSRSPDLSPIEHAWDVLGRRVRDAYPLPPASLAELRLRLIAQWDLIPQDELNALCDSMPQRLRACIAADGGHTRF